MQVSWGTGRGEREPTPIGRCIYTESFDTITDKNTHARTRESFFEKTKRPKRGFETSVIYVCLPPALTPCFTFFFFSVAPLSALLETNSADPVGIVRVEGGEELLWHLGSEFQPRGGQGQEGGREYEHGWDERHTLNKRPILVIIRTVVGVALVPPQHLDMHCTLEFASPTGGVFGPGLRYCCLCTELFRKPAAIWLRCARVQSLFSIKQDR